MAVVMDRSASRDAAATQQVSSGERDGGGTTRTAQERAWSKVDYTPPEFLPPPAQGEPLLPPRPPTCLPAPARPVWPVDFETEARALMSQRLDLLIEEVERLSREVQALRRDLDDLRNR